MISFVDVIVSPIYHLAKDNINLKLACYPNRIYYGDLDVGKYKNLYIDMFDIYGKTNITSLEKSAVEYTQRIVENRIKYFCESKVEDYFELKNNTMQDYYLLLFFGSMNITRVLGHILHYCWLSNLSQGKKINRQAIEEACEQYYLDYTRNYFDKSRYSKGVFDEKIDIFVQETLIEELINEAQKNKTYLRTIDNSYLNDLDLVPTSHFTVNSELENMLDSLEFNGFVHKVSELASKGSSNKNKNATNIIYAFDFGLTIFEKLKYGKPENKDSKFYQQRAFDYSHIVTAALDNNKKIKCQQCSKEYPMGDLDILQRFRMKCDNCDDGICKIEYDLQLSDTVRKNIEEAVWTTEEIEIMNSIYLLNKNSKEEEKVTASLIGKEIDRSYQFVARRCKELAEADYVIRNGNTPFEYDLTEKTINKLKEMNLVK
ncbi:hypothetical protein [Salibacterium qingdaonense]|uniref:Uncharacterized protein n=1 Tax=Salibacterium qingdaonense TaxID=266892 RepID=A0A1I4QZL2_9BACI|nr:hypothetical protein [Salibacterium qingdaonense]SFM45479.1 hypothetical protein SAMN04488054_1554 [Salibacterium qingdaonense]